MSGLTIDAAQCKGCGLCLKSCASNALSLVDQKAVLDAERCLLCGVCLEACPFGALTIAKAESSIDLSAYRGVWVFAEQADGQPLAVAYELLGKGRELADARGVPLTALLLGGPALKAQAPGLIAAGADRVLLATHAALAANPEDRFTTLLARLVNEQKPEILLFGATGCGRSLAPRLAARLHTGLTADCTMLEIDASAGLLLQTRPAFGGNLMATIICPNGRPQMATVRPGVMAARPPRPDRLGEIIEVPYADDLPTLIEVLRTRSSTVESIADAHVIVAAGRGIGSSKNLALAKRLAEQLGGVLGCTRPLVDTGWCEYKHQIGQTGCAVAPQLLIACGISGAIQHLAGIAGAETIIAINTDAAAPIFSVADYKVVGDCVEVLKALSEALAETQSPPSVKRSAGPS